MSNGTLVAMRVCSFENEGTFHGLAAVAAGSAAAGFGWSAGRDLYREGKEWILTPVVLAAVAERSGYAASNLPRDHREPSMARLTGAALTAVGSLALRVVMIGDATWRQPGQLSSGTGVGGAMLIHVLAVVIRLLIGLAQRRRQMRSFAVERHNRTQGSSFSGMES